MMLKCITAGKMPGKGTGGLYEGTASAGLKWYWGLALCETEGGLLSSYVQTEWHTRVVGIPVYPACRD